MKRALHRLCPPAFLLCILAFGSAGCDTSSGDSLGGDLALRTTQSTYATGDTIKAALEGKSPDAPSPVYLNGCGSRPLLAVEKQEGGEWESYRSGLCKAIYRMGFFLETEVGDRWAAGFISEPGMYRLRQQVKVERAKSEGVQTLYSNRFTVE